MKAHVMKLENNCVIVDEEYFNEIKKQSEFNQERINEIAEERFLEYVKESGIELSYEVNGIPYMFHYDLLNEINYEERGYPETEYYERRLIYTTYSSGFREHNIAAFKSRLKKYFDYEIVNNFVKDGNGFWTTDEIIAAVRVSLSLDLLTDEEWKRAIPIIERGLEANKAYVRMLDEMSDILEKYCEEWEDLDMRYTFMQRVPLECWQGRFSRHSQNPEQKPNYS